MYAGISPKATAVQVDRTQARRMSILDYVIEEKNALLPALSKADNARMDQYFSAVRDFENTLKGGTATAGGAACAVGTAPAPMAYPDHRSRPWRISWSWGSRAISPAASCSK